MKKEHQLIEAFTTTLLSCCTLCVTSCVNPSALDIQESNIPITFSAKQKTTATTKVTNTAFNKGDNVGLYAVLTSESISNNLYIDNLHLKCGDDAILIPEKTVFYPEGDLALDFISYYPYLPDAKLEDSGSITVSVEADQRDIDKHSQSDFLIAKKTEVRSSTKTVELEYHHKMAKIKITLIPGENENINEMLKSNPKIVATSLYTKAKYNLQDDTFSDLSDMDDIIPFGKWIIEEGALIGKEFIIIPQKTGSDEQVFTLEWNGKIYHCLIPKLDALSTTQCEVNISAIQNESNILKGIVGSVCDWINGTGGSTNNQKDHATIHIAALSFSQSNVYRVYHNGKPLVEICKEYLCSENLTSRAIVAYPVLDNEKTDLSQGVVLQLLDSDKPINGGEISWDTNTNSFNYQEGNSMPIKKFYLNSKKEILLEKADNIINVDIVSYKLRDIRNGQLDEYPIVKIGTQYWMRTELHATTYQDGKALSKQTILGQNAGYFKPDEHNIYFYNGEAIIEGKLNPTGWRIPSEQDWEKLKTYIVGNASLLKAGVWQSLSAGEACLNSNLTQFNAYPVGMWYNGAHYNANKMTGFWSWDEEKQEIPKQTVFFIGESNNFIPNGTLITDRDYYKALSIRCIKE